MITCMFVPNCKQKEQHNNTNQQRQSINVYHFKQCIIMYEHTINNANHKKYTRSDRISSFRLFGSSTRPLMNVYTMKLVIMTALWNIFVISIIRNDILLAFTVTNVPKHQQQQPNIQSQQQQRTSIRNEHNCHSDYSTTKQCLPFPITSTRLNVHNNNNSINQIGKTRSLWNRIRSITRRQLGMNDDSTNSDEDDRDDDSTILNKGQSKFIDWVYGNDSKKNMVRPIGIDGKIIEDVSTKNNKKKDDTIESKSVFGTLFAGMPSLSEILGSDDTTNTNTGTSSSTNKDYVTTGSKTSTKSVDETTQQQQQQNELKSSSSASASKRRQQQKSSEDDDTWFDNDRRIIENNYNDIYAKMMNQVETQRQRSSTNENNNNNNNNSNKNSALKSTIADDNIIPPPNAEALIRSILKQEMDNEIKMMKEKLGLQRLQQYEQEQMIQFIKEDNINFNYDTVVISNEDKLQILFDKSQNEYELQQSIQTNYNNYVQYEQQIQINNTNNIRKEQQQQQQQQNLVTNQQSQPLSSTSSISSSGTTGSTTENDLDTWVLQRFQEMIEKNENIDGGEVVLDSLEEKLDALTDRIQKKLNSDTIGPNEFDTFKEWQMYRSIATRLSESQLVESTLSTSTSEQDKVLSTASGNEFTNKVRTILQSWKEYISKEETIRKQSGLSTLGPKLPFAWQEAELEEKLQQRLSLSSITTTSPTTTLFNNNNNDNSGTVMSPTKKKTAIEVRKEVNKMAINAMESLLRSPTIDKQRRDNIQKELEYLKLSLEKNDYLDIEEVPAEEEYDNNNTDNNDNNRIGQNNERKSIDTSKLFRPYTGDYDDDDNNEYNADEINALLSDYDDDDYSTTELKATIISSEDTAMAASSSSSTYSVFYEKQQKTDVSKTLQTTSEEVTSSPYGVFYEKQQKSELQPSAKTPAPPKTAFFSDDNDEDTGLDFDEELSRDSKLGTMEEQKLEAMYRRAGARTNAERATIKKQYDDYKAFEKERRDTSGLSGDSNTIMNDSNDVDSYTDAAMANVKYNISEVVTKDGDFDATAILATIGPRPTRTKKNTIRDDNIGAKPRVELSDDEIQKKAILDSRYRAVSAIGGGRYKDDADQNANQRAEFEEYIEKEIELRQNLDETDVNDINEIQTDLSLTSDPLDDVTYAQEVIASLGVRPKPKRARIIPDERMLSDGEGDVSSGSTEDDDDDDDDDDSDDDDDEEISMIPKWLQKEQQEAKTKQNKQSGTSSSSKRKSFSGNDIIDEAFDDQDYEKNMRQLAEYNRRRQGKQGGSLGIDISDVLGPRRSSMYQSDDYADYKYDDNSFSRQRNRQDDWVAGSFEKRKSDMLEYIELDLPVINALMDHKDSVHSTGVSQYLKRINKPFKEFAAIFRVEGVLVDVTGLHYDAWTNLAKKMNFNPLPTIEECRRASVTRPEVAVKDIFFWSDNFIECKQIATEFRIQLHHSFDVWKNENRIQDPVLNFGLQSKDDVGAKSENQQISRSIPRPLLPITSEAEKIEIMAKSWARTADALQLRKPTRDEVISAMLLSPDIAVKRIFRWADDPIDIDAIVSVYYANSGSMLGIDTRPEQLQQTRKTKSVIGGKRVVNRNDVMEVYHKAWTIVAGKFNFEAPIPDESIAAFVLNDPEIVVRRGFGWTEDSDIVKQVVKAFKYTFSKLQDDSFDDASLSKYLDDNVATAISKTAVGTNGKMDSYDPIQDDVFVAAKVAWQSTASRVGKSSPDDEQIMFALSVGPEEAIINGFQWATSNFDVAQILSVYKVEIAKTRKQWNGDRALTGPSLIRTPSITMKSVSKPPSGPSNDDIFTAAFDSWTATASKSGYPVPDQEQVQFGLSVGPEDAIMYGFGWTDDSDKVKELVITYRQELSKRKSKWQTPSTSVNERKINNSLPKVTVVPEVYNWIASLLKNEMQCGVVSYFDKNQVDTLLEYAGISALIQHDKRVCASNKYSTDDDELLGMALRLERRPDHCAVFDCAPYTSIAAHNVEMKSISLVGPYPRFELMMADATTASFNDLTAMNIRRLFSENIYDQPLQETQAILQKTRVTKTTFADDD